MATVLGWLRIYLIIGLPTFIVLGAAWAWADNRGHQQLAKPLLPLILAAFPALIIAGLIVVLGSILQ